MPTPHSTLTTAISNDIKSMVNTKADKTNGTSQITDNTSYSNLGTSSGATQAQINAAINTKLGNIITIINGTGGSS